MSANASTTPQSATVSTAFANALAVAVKDAGNNPVSGVNVTFTAPGSGASGIFSNSTTTITVATNASGVAFAPFTANSTAGGPYSVTAAASGLTAVNFALTNTAAATTGAGGTPQVTVVGTEFDCALLAKVSNASGPVAGIDMQFIAIAAGNGASATLSSTTGSENISPLTISTDAAGFAAAIVKGNLIAGTYNVTAGIAGSGQNATYRLTNLAVNDPIFKDGNEDPLANCAEAQ
jgi:hypothetical protein